MMSTGSADSEILLGAREIFVLVVQNKRINILLRNGRNAKSVENSGSASILRKEGNMEYVDRNRCSSALALCVFVGGLNKVRSCPNPIDQHLLFCGLLQDPEAVAVAGWADPLRPWRERPVRGLLRD